MRKDSDLRKFYYEYDEGDQDWVVLESDGGYELGAFYDTAMFWCSSEQSAIDAIELLMELQEND